ncbi:hypothetical protein QQF64_035503 [Cirrhinus molitorella]|uniref:Uncharacterized protein n=1 Tax=Cirrhinus molitorella TaxID=172907 RepID=A0ABR3NFZ9_9TELE
MCLCHFDIVNQRGFDNYCLGQPRCLISAFEVAQAVCQASSKKCKVHQMELFCCSACAQPSILHLKHMPSGSRFKHVEDEGSTVIPHATSISMKLKWNRLAPATSRNPYDTRGM